MSLTPLLYKKVEHRDKILYNESTPTTPKGRISMPNKYLFPVADAVHAPR